MNDMNDNFEHILKDIAEEADARVDYNALYRVVCDRANARSTAVRGRMRALGTLAACLIVFASVMLLKGTHFPFASRKQEAAPAAEAAQAAPAALYAMEDNAYAMEESADGAYLMEDSAPAPMFAQAPEADAVAPEASQPQPPLAASGREGVAPSGNSGQAPDLKEAAPQMLNAPLTRLVDRTHTMTADEIPPDLVAVSTLQADNIAYKSEDMLANSTALWALERMLEGARAEGIDGFYLASAYRDYALQASIWDKKIAKEPHYGENGAPVASMPPGASEHQTGLAFDISSLAHPSLSAGVADTAQGIWLRENAHRYGFILRYPEGKESVTGVIFEPWHFRYVGKPLAKYLMEHDLTLEEFYA